MKILIYRWHAYNQQDIEDTFQALGIAFTVYTKQPKSIEQDGAYTDELADYLRKQDFEFLFSINYFPVLAAACSEAGIPYVCWTCDSPLLAMYHKSVFADTNFIFAFDRQIYEEFKNAGCKHIFYLPLAANTTRLQGLRHTSSGSCYEVSFIGSLYEKNSYDPIASQLPDYLCGYLEGAIQAQTLVSGGNLLPKLLTPDICRQLEKLTDYRQAEESFSDLRLLFSTTVLGFKAASVTRQRALRHLAVHLNHQRKHPAGENPDRSPADVGEGVHVFTDSEDILLPLVHRHPPVNYHTETPLIFRNSKINLNMTIPNIQTGIPLRIWDILSSGGFLLTDFCPELPQYFTPGKELAVFGDEEELCFQAEYYLKHDDTRMKIARRALEIIQKEHTLKKRLETLLDKCEKMF